MRLYCTWNKNGLAEVAAMRRERMGDVCSAADSIDKLRGIVEIDEAFFGGKDANKQGGKQAL